MSRRKQINPRHVDSDVDLMTSLTQAPAAQEHQEATTIDKGQFLLALRVCFVRGVA